MNTSEDNEKRARDLVKKASGILKPLKNETLNSDGSIRLRLIEGLDCIEEYLRIANSLTDKFDTSFISMNVMNLTFFLSNVSKEEFQYSIDRLTEWKNVGYENCNNALAQLLTCELGKDIAERRLDWTDREYVEIITECKATFGSSLSRLLYNPTVREYYITKANEGDIHYAFDLGTYYYEAEEYSAAFNVLKNLEDSVTAQYLGLMYYYGRGTVPNPELARKYLEIFNDKYWPKDEEEVWALGDLYAHYENKRKQYDLYLPLIENPYRDDDDPFLKKMLRQCMLYRRGVMTQDWMILGVEIKSENLACEFSFELAPYCHLTVDWGDGTCDKYGDLDKTGTITCHHSYSQPGTYTINIESLWAKVIEGFEFSRYQRQLHSIYLGDCPGLGKLSIIGQSLTNLDITPGGYRKDFLTGVICRDNALTDLDLRNCPNITHLDCSSNPIKTIKLPRHSVLSVVAMSDSVVNRSKIDELLRLNRGTHCNQMNYDDLTAIDMRLEHYFRRTNWNKVRNYIRKNERDYYDHQLAECEFTFAKLKEMSKVTNHNPYEEKGGYLTVDGSYVSDDTILHHEEFFISEEAWTTCLATKVRDPRRHDPWMGFPPTPPEYFVASCLVNMIKSWRELKKL